MTNMNLRGARVIDPVLTAVAQGYRHGKRVGSVLFPPVPVEARGGKVIEFGRDSFMKYSSRRAPGASVQRIQFGYQGKPFSLVQDALDAVVPREIMDDAAAVPGIDMASRAVNSVMDKMNLALEIEQAELASNPAIYAANNQLMLAGSSCWSNDLSYPMEDIDNAKDQVRITCGLEPNVLVLSNAGFKALKRHPKVIERFKYTTSESITTKMLAGLFDLDDVAVGKATYVEGPEDNAKFKEVWQDNAILAYVPTQDMAMEQPSFGYTYTLRGNPFVEQERWDGDTRSFLYGVTYDRAPVLTGIASGFLFQNLVEYDAQ